MRTNRALTHQSRLRPKDNGVTRANVRIRPALASDAPALAELLASIDLSVGTISGPAAPDSTPTTVAERLVEVIASDRIVLVAADGDAGVEGLVIARPDSAGTLGLTPVLHITHVMVAPSARRRGIGRSLLAAAVHLAEEQGLDQVVVTAVAGARDSNRYLARLGFAPLVTHRIAPTAALHRSLGMADLPNRVAVLRRARRMRAARVAQRLPQQDVGA